MSSVNNIVNVNDNDIVNDDVFALSNFSDPFYSAFKKLTQLWICRSIFIVKKVASLKKDL